VFSALAMNFLGGLLGLGFIAGGALAVYAYRQRIVGAVLSLGSGALLGALSGLFGFLIFTLLATVEIALSHTGGELRQAIFDSMNQTAQNADPQVQQRIQEMIQQLKTPEGFVVLILFSGIVLCLLFIFFSILGGAIGSSMTRKTPK
jgi:hypothetical protein